MRQLIIPNPGIPCRPGWCLEYVNNAFQVPERFGSATDAWYGSATQHRDRDFPSGVWHPVWYGIVQEPLGHVVLRAPDGSVYSTSDDSTVPHHHPDLADLERYYAKYGLNLVYRGWTEDVEGTPVIAPDTTIALAGTITPQEDDMGFVDDLSDEAAAKIARHVHDLQVDREGGGTNTLRWSLGAESQRTEGIIARTAEATARLILNTAVARGGDSVGGETSLAGVIAYFDQNRADILNAASKPPEGIPGLDQGQVNAAIKAGLTAALAGTSATITFGGTNG